MLVHQRVILIELPSSTSSTIVSSWSLPGPSTLALEARQKKGVLGVVLWEIPFGAEELQVLEVPGATAVSVVRNSQPATPPRNWLAIQHMIILYMYTYTYTHTHTHTYTYTYTYIYIIIYIYICIIYVIYIIYDSPNQCPRQHLALVPLGGGALIGAAVSKPPRRQPWRLRGLPVNLYNWGYPLINYHNYGKSPFFMGKSTISMAMFNSYVSHYQRVCPGLCPTLHWVVRMVLTHLPPRSFK